MLGVAACQRGEFEQGIECISKAIQTSPKNAYFHNNLANALLFLGRGDEASASYAAALDIDPKLAEAHYNTGNILKDQDRPEEAAQRYERALAINPEYAEARSNLGNVLKEIGHLEEAVDCYETILAARPDLAEVHFNLGNTLIDLGRSANATDCYQKALAINPNYAEAHANMGNACMEQGLLDDDADCYQKGLAITPDNVEALNNLGAVRKEQDRWDDAIACFRKALESDLNYLETLHNLGAVYGDLGHIEKAADCYRQAGKLEGERPDKSIRANIKAALLLPPILPGIDAIDPLRQALAEKVQAIGGNGDDLNDPHRAIGKTGFFLAYHGLNDRDVQRQIADMYLRVAPSLAFEKPHPPAPAMNRRIRVGIVSAHLHSHTIGKIYLGVIENLDRERFDVIIFRTPQQQDAVADAIDSVVTIFNDLDLARRRIAEEDLDVLFYPDIGMEPFTYFLAFARLAPVQLAGWGHPVTTGIANVDYFLSSEDLEPPGADEHYTERLVRLRHLPAFYTRPPPVATVERAYFGLPEDGQLYIIPQTLFKFHPSFDLVLGDILRQDEDGRLVLISGNRKNWDTLLLNRFRESFPDEADRVLFVPRMGSEDFIRLMGLADALLDTSHFCGGFSSTEAFAAGLAIVTWPGAFMRGRVAAAQYQAMGITDLIADDGDSYAQLALRLAQDREFRHDIKNRIAENSAVLFENIEVVRKIERFFKSALDAANREQALEGWQAPHEQHPFPTHALFSACESRKRRRLRMDLKTFMNQPPEAPLWPEKP